MQNYVFRGRMKDAPYTWVYGFYTEQDDAFGKTEGIICKNTGENRFEKIVVEKETVGICTGLKDRSGNDIFEGDLIRIADHTPFFENGREAVRFENGGFYPFCIAGWECVVKSENCEVVGNIHDQPDRT